MKNKNRSLFFLLLLVSFVTCLQAMTSEPFKQGEQEGSYNAKLSGDENERRQSREDLRGEDATNRLEQGGSVDERADFDFSPDKLDEDLRVVLQEQQRCETSLKQVQIDALSEDQLREKADQVEQERQYWFKQKSHAFSILQSRLERKKGSLSSLEEEQKLFNTLNICRKIWSQWDSQFSDIQDEIEKRDVGATTDEDLESETDSMSGLLPYMKSMKLSGAPLDSNKTTTQKAPSIIVTASFNNLKNRLQSFLTTVPVSAHPALQAHQREVQQIITDLLRANKDDATLAQDLVRRIKSKGATFSQKIDSKLKNGDEVNYKEAKQLRSIGKISEAFQKYNQVIGHAEEAVHFWSESELFYTKLRDITGEKIRRLGKKIKIRIQKIMTQCLSEINEIRSIEHAKQRASQAGELSLNALTQESMADKEQSNEIGETWNSIARKYEAIQRQLTKAGEAYAQNHNAAAQELEGKVKILEVRVGESLQHLNFLTSAMQEWKSKYQTEESRYLETLERVPEADGTKAMSLIYKRRFVGPLIRIERKVSANGDMISETKMAAEYLMVKFSSEESAAALLGKLKENFSDNNLTLEAVSRRSLICRLNFQPAPSSQDPAARLKLFDQIKKAIQEKHLAVDCYPSTLLELASSQPAAPPQVAAALPEPWHFNSNFGINPPANLFNVAAPAISPGQYPIRVAVLDTGIRDTHHAFLNNITRYEDDAGEIFYGYNACTADPNAKGLPQDKSGHGTHVAGIIAGAPADVTVVEVKKKDLTKPHDSKAFVIQNENILKACIRGMASIPGMTELLICKMIEPGEVEGFADRALECIRYAREQGARVINCSWGGARDDAGELSQKNLEMIKKELSNDPPYEFFKKDAAGNDVLKIAPPVVAVMAAGNLREGQAQEKRDKDKYPTYPASLSLPNAIAVAATRQDGKIADFSYYGKQSVQIAAPGAGIISASCAGDTLYRKLSGTSMAAPLVAAAAALLMKKFPELSPQKIVEHLGDTARKIEGSHIYTDSQNEQHEISVESGYLNLTQALAALPISLKTKLEAELEAAQKQIAANQALALQKKSMFQKNGKYKAEK